MHLLIKKDEFKFLKEKEIFNKIYSGRLKKVDELSKIINYDDLKYYVYSSNTEKDFRELKDPITFLNKLREDKLTLQQAQDKHKAFNRYLRNIRKVSKSVFNA